MKQSPDVELTISTKTFIRFWLVILGFIALALIGWAARVPLALLAISFFLALVLNRPVSFIARYLPGKSRTAAIFIAYLIIATMISVLLLTIVPIFARQLSSFIANLPRTINQLKQESGWLGGLLAHYHLTDQFNQWLIDVGLQLRHTTGNMGAAFINALSNIFAVLGNTCLVLFATFFMLVEGPKWEEKFWRFAYANPARRQRHRRMARKMYDVVSGYMVGQATVGVISGTFTAVVVGVLATVFRFDISLVWPAWITIFMMIFVPMFGAVIGGTIVTLILMVYSPPAAIIYAIVFTIEQQIENNFVQPRIQSRHMETSALIILIAITLGMQAGGLLGAMIAIPLSGCVIILMRDFLQSHGRGEVSQDGSSEAHLAGVSSAPVIFVPADRKYIGPELDIIPPLGNDRGQRRRRRPGRHSKH